MPLTNEQKQHIFEAINDKDESQLTPCLILAVEHNIKLPIIGEISPLKELITALKACQSDTTLKTMQLEIIKHYITQIGASKFKTALEEDFDTESWASSEFLTFVANTFDITLESEPMVHLTIYDGKVYWKIVKDDQEIYRNQNTIENYFQQRSQITMSWQQFRQFKDAGKRASSVSITKSRFHDECKLRSPLISEEITNQLWQQLKDKGILDSNHRLSHYWYTANGHIPLTFNPNSRFRYNKIAEALNAAARNETYSKVVAPSCKIFRPARSVKEWCSTSLLQNSAPKWDNYKTRPFDVSSHKDLTAHSQKQDGLDLDHIPSTNWMKQFQSDEINAGRHQQNDAENRDNWGVIAIDSQLHHSGITHGKSKEEQLTMEKPFFEELKDYLDKSETCSPNEFLQVLGAFRYLYRCQVKQKFSQISNGFFSVNERQSLKAEVDNLLLEKLSTTINKL